VFPGRYRPGDRSAERLAVAEGKAAASAPGKGIASAVPTLCFQDSSNGFEDPGLLGNGLDLKPFSRREGEGPPR
jgi:hypothetical protein